MSEKDQAPEAVEAEEAKPEEAKRKPGRPANRVFVDVNLHPMTGDHLFRKVFSSDGPIFAGRGALVSKADAEQLCDGARKMCRRITPEQLAAENAARRNPDAEAE